MTDYIGDELVPKVIRVTKGCDRVFTATRNDADSGDPVDWDAGLSISIDIDKTAPTVIAAVVNDENAVFRIESTIADQVKKGTAWRVSMSQAGSPTLETAVMVGTFERQDGKP